MRRAPGEVPNCAYMRQCSTALVVLLHVTSSVSLLANVLPLPLSSSMHALPLLLMASSLADALLLRRGEGTLLVGGANAPPQILKNNSLGLNFTIYAPSLIQVYAPTR